MGVDGRHDATPAASLEKMVHEDRCSIRGTRERNTHRDGKLAGPLMVSVGCIAGSFRLSLGKAIARSKYSLAINIGS